MTRIGNAAAAAAVDDYAAARVEHDDDAEDPVQQLTFRNAVEFQAGVEVLLRNDVCIVATRAEDLEEGKVLDKLGKILDEYQEQSHLLDPHLEQLASPLILVFRNYMRTPQPCLTGSRLHRLARLLYCFTKVRGAKTISRLFPHETSDLVVLIALFSDHVALETTTWETRYLLLLWLSLVSMLPFALTSLDTIIPVASTSSCMIPTRQSRIEEIGLKYLGCTSRERDGAVSLLSRFESRQDAPLESFLSTCRSILEDPTSSIYLVSGIAQTVCEIAKVASAPSLLRAWPALYLLRASCDTAASTKRGSLMSKYRIKLAGRLALLQLPIKAENASVSDEVAEIVQELLESVQHKETMVRWSAAKYLARIAERLPSFMSHQITESLFEIFQDEDHCSSDADEALPEHAWQGGCLALAELARRDTIPEDLIGPTLDCVLRALHFDRKRGVQSIGVGVRDSAAYVLWSLARAISSQQASFHATQLAIHLVTVSLFDREIQIRRAASAAFQESVGRLGVLPEGIDVLRKIDFFTVSLRKRAFLEAAPLVAIHAIYRTAMIRHLLEVGLTHYDSDIRSLSAQSLGSIVLLDAANLIESIVHSQITAMQITKDSILLHGIILSLASLAIASHILPVDVSESIRLRIFLALSCIDSKHLTASSSSFILAASLEVIEKSCTTEGLRLSTDWWRFIEVACRGSDESMHTIASHTVRAVSLISDSLDSRSASQRTSAVLILGQVDYRSFNLGSKSAVVDRLISFANSKISTIEGLRNAIEALVSISCQQTDDVPLQVVSVLQTILSGFSNYTTDQRGDVGSWVRIASIRSLSILFSHYLVVGSPHVHTLFSQDTLDQCVSFLLKLSVERLDSVRETSGRVLEELSRNVFLAQDTSLLLRGTTFEKLRISTGAWKDHNWSAVTLLPFLSVAEYRSRFLEGTIISATTYAANSPLLDYVDTLPTASEDGWSLLRLMTDIYEIGKANWSANRLFIPFLTVFGIFSESEVMERVQLEEGGLIFLRRLVALSMRSIATIRSTPRLLATSKLVVNLLSIESIRPFGAEKIAILLDHPLSLMREHTADLLQDYLLQADEPSEEALELLQSFDWSIEIPDRSEEMDLHRLGALTTAMS